MADKWSMPCWNATVVQVQSRGAYNTGASSDSTNATTTSLDGLRAGDVGELLPREAVKADALATNEFLPSATPAAV